MQSARHHMKSFTVQPPETDPEDAFQQPRNSHDNAADDALRRDSQTALMRFPNTSFGISLGLAGQAIMWKSIGLSTSVSTYTGTKGPKAASSCFWVASCVVLVVFSGLYGAKVARHPKLVRFEWEHAHRAHFFNAPHLAVLMLAIGAPPTISDVRGLRVVMYLSGVVQTILTQIIYARWLFGESQNIGHARPPFLLSMVGWLLLAILAQQARLPSLAAFFFGGGFILYLLVLISIFLSMHTSIREKGSPALFLLLAPPSLSSTALAGFTDSGTFTKEACMLLGWCCVLLLLLFHLGPQLLAKPLSLGAYWAYVFPLSAFATAGTLYADSEGTLAARGFACFLILLSALSLVVVVLRMSWHHVGVVQGKHRWDDPIVGAWQKQQEAEAEEAEVGLAQRPTATVAQRQEQEPQPPLQQQQV